MLCHVSDLMLGQKVRQQIDIIDDISKDIQLGIRRVIGRGMCVIGGARLAPGQGWFDLGSSGSPCAEGLMGGGWLVRAQGEAEGLEVSASLPGWLKAFACGGGGGVTSRRGRWWLWQVVAFASWSEWSGRLVLDQVVA